MSTPDQPPAPVLKSGLYWRRSKWSGKKCVPAILTTDGHNLRLSSQDGVAFDVAGRQVQVKFSRLQTMTLTVNGQTYDLVGQPAHQSPAFSEQQRAELAAADSPGATPGFGGTPVDAMGIVRNLAPWREVLPRIGVRMR